MTVEQSTSWVWIGICAASLFGIGGLLLLIRGMIGRRIDDHPLCRSCGFDLTGRAEGSTRCPECGRDVTVAGAIRIGHRQRRGGIIAAGAAAILLCLLVAAPVIIASATSFDPQPYKPMWMLQREARSGNVPTRDAALLELERRYKDGKLSTGDVASLVSLALDVQADSSKTWNPRWGNIVELGRRKQNVSDEQWARYARQAVPFRLLVRSKVRRGDPLTVGLQMINARVGDNPRFTAAYDARDLRFAINDLELPHPQGRGTSMGSSGLHHGGGSTSFPQFDLTPLLDRLSDGKHTVRYRSKLYVREGQDDTRAVAVVDIDETAEVDIRPRSEPAIGMTTDPALRDAMEQTLTINAVSVGDYQNNAGQLTISIGGVPAGLGHTVWVCAGGREWKVGQVACPAGKNNFGFGLNGDLTGLPPDVAAVEVRLRPAPDVAAQSIDTYDIWGNEIVLKNVPVRRLPVQTIAPSSVK